MLFYATAVQLLKGVSITLKNNNKKFSISIMQALNIICITLFFDYNASKSQNWLYKLPHQKRFSAKPLTEVQFK